MATDWLEKYKPPARRPTETYQPPVIRNKVPNIPAPVGDAGGYGETTFKPDYRPPTPLPNFRPGRLTDRFDPANFGGQRMPLDKRNFPEPTFSPFRPNVEPKEGGQLVPPMNDGNPSEMIGSAKSPINTSSLPKRIPTSPSGITGLEPEFQRFGGVPTANLPPVGSRSLEQEQALLDTSRMSRNRELQRSGNSPEDRLEFAQAGLTERTNLRNEWEAQRGITPELKAAKYLRDYGMTPAENVKRIQRNETERLRQRKDNITIFRGSRGGMDPNSNPHVQDAMERQRISKEQNSPAGAGNRAKAKYLMENSGQVPNIILGVDFGMRDQTKAELEKVAAQAENAAALAASSYYDTRELGKEWFEPLPARPDSKQMFNEFGQQDYSPENYERIRDITQKQNESTQNAQKKQWPTEKTGTSIPYQRPIPTLRRLPRYVSPTISDRFDPAEFGGERMPLDPRNFPDLNKKQYLPRQSRRKPVEGIGL